MKLIVCQCHFDGDGFALRVKTSIQLSASLKSETSKILGFLEQLLKSGLFKSLTSIE